jgi:hypothetical protein
MEEQEMKRRALYDYEHRHDTGLYGADVPDGLQAQTRPATDQEVQDAILSRILKRLDYHTPTSNQIPRYQNLRDASKTFVTAIIRNCPPNSDETMAAIRGVEASLMCANKAIALEHN